ncbi:MAG: hydantoinase/oxoprolinase family protein, partial [Planctomycetes bacterium]|nr:hydantoinase/oxoprolinase family protein [Planctomycetota bacterium]
KEGFSPEDHVYRRSADLRYFGQAFEVRVDAPSGDIDSHFAKVVEDRFHDAHRALYGYDFRDDDRQPVEWVNLRVSGIGPITRPVIQEMAIGDGDVSRALTGEREIWFEGDPVKTSIYWRSKLEPGDCITGPAIIEEFGSTVPIHPGFQVRIDRFRNIIVTKAGS